VVEDAQRVRLDGARVRIDTRDRLGMDLVAQVGLRRLAPGDDGVGERP
jgi:hypothetical protein